MKWINVKDRLPEDYARVIAYGYDHPDTDWWRDKRKLDVDFCIFNEPCSNDSKYTFTLLYDHCCGSSDLLHDVTHWMPLPDNPTE